LKLSVGRCNTVLIGGCKMEVDMRKIADYLSENTKVAEELKNKVALLIAIKDTLNKEQY